MGSLRTLRSESKDTEKTAQEQFDRLLLVARQIGKEPRTREQLTDDSFADWILDRRGLDG